jgi:serine protease Do
VVRGGKTLDLTATLAERQTETADSNGPSAQPRASGEKLGIHVVGLTRDVRQQLGIPPDVSGVVVENVGETSPLADQGVQPGDVITEVNGTPVKAPGDFENALAAVHKGDYARLYVRRFQPREVSRYVVIRLE